MIDEKEKLLNNKIERTKIFHKILKEYLEEFNSKVKNITARYCIQNDRFYIDYSALKRIYSKQDAADARAVFNKYCNDLELMLEILKFDKNSKIEYYTGKTEVSSSLIGKGLYVYDIEFANIDEYVEADGRGNITQY